MSIYVCKLSIKDNSMKREIRTFLKDDISLKNKNQDIMCYVLFVATVLSPARDNYIAQK